VLCGSFGRSLEDGEPAVDAHLQIGAVIEQLKEIAIQRRTVFVAAADLSHVGAAFGDPEPAPPDGETREQVRSRDEKLLRAITHGDRQQFFELVRADSDSNKVCGLAPIYMTLWAAGAKTGTWNGYLQCQADEADTSFVSIAGAALYG
jgi:AmmeMemoRadiSam system protein B